MKTSATIAARENALNDSVHIFGKNRDETLDAAAGETAIIKFAEEIERKIKEALNELGGWIGLDGSTEVDANAPNFMEIHDGGLETYTRACIEREKYKLGRDLTPLEIESLQHFTAFRFGEIEKSVMAQKQGEFYGQMFQTTYEPFRPAVANAASQALPIFTKVLGWVDDFLTRDINLVENFVSDFRLIDPVDVRAVRIVVEEKVYDRLKTFVGLGMLSKDAALKIATHASRSVEKKVVESAASKVSAGTRNARPDMGEYRHTAGHHVHAKKAFEGHVNYDPRRGFSISNEFMRTHGIDHNRVTQEQRRLFNELAQSGRSNTIQEHSRIAVESLVTANCPRPLARQIVADSLRQLRNSGVRNPTNIPWNNK